MQSARDLVARFVPLEVRKAVLTSAEMRGTPAPEYHSIQWIKPALLCEVAFTEWTEDGRIRHPSFQGLRVDKNTRDVQKETPKPAPAKAKAGSLTVAGIAITHPRRVISEPGHVTKGELAEYYAGIAPFILPRIVRRPISLLRCPTGIDGECFFQRNPGKGLGPDILPFDVRHGGKKYRYLYIEDEKGLLEAAQMGVIEIHPWGARIDAIDSPDRLVFDLDPSPEVPFEAVKLAAQDLRKRLEDKGIESVLKCTGGKGLHLTAPLAGTQTWQVAKEFAASVAAEMVAAAPEAYVATMSKAKRTGKIFIDYFRNDYSATAIADYSVRARPGAPVAVPLEWTELKGLKSASAFTMKAVLKRLAKTKEDAFSRLKPQNLPAA